MMVLPGGAHRWLERPSDKQVHLQNRYDLNRGRSIQLSKCIFFKLSKKLLLVKVSHSK